MSVAFAHAFTAATTRTATRAIPTPTAPTSSNQGSKKKTTIIGAAVGGAVGGLIVLIALIYFLLHRKNNNVPATQNSGAGNVGFAPTNMMMAGPPDDKYPPHNYYSVYPDQPPTQLPTGDEEYVAELSGAEIGRKHTPRYSIGTVASGSYQTSPPQSPPTASVAYFYPPPSSQSTSPLSYAPSVGFAPSPSQPFYQQTYYPPPGAPPPPQASPPVSHVSEHGSNTGPMSGVQGTYFPSP